MTTTQAPALDASETPLDDLVKDTLKDMATGNWSMLLREAGDFGASINCPADIVQEIARRAQPAAESGVEAVAWLPADQLRFLRDGHNRQAVVTNYTDEVATEPLFPAPPDYTALHDRIEELTLANSRLRANVRDLANAKRVTGEFRDKFKAEKEAAEARARRMENALRAARPLIVDYRTQDALNVIDAALASAPQVREQPRPAVTEKRSGPITIGERIADTMWLNTFEKRKLAKKIAAAIEAERAALSQADAGGWRLVPIEPTEAMLATQGRSRPDLATTEISRQMAERLNETVRQNAALIWKEMLAAAPSVSPAKGSEALASLEKNDG